MPIKHSKRFGYWNAGCSSLEAIGPDIVLGGIKFLFHLAQIWYKCDLVKVGVYFKSV